MKRDISSSMKRATISFTEPGRGRSVFQEAEGCVSQPLRDAIAIAREAFYNSPYMKSPAQPDRESEEEK